MLCHDERMDPLVIVLTVVAAILSIVLVVVSVQAILVLQELRRTLQRVNALTNTIESTLIRVHTPFQNLGGMIQGLKTGFHMLDTFAHYIKNSSSAKHDDFDE